MIRDQDNLKRILLRAGCVEEPVPEHWMKLPFVSCFRLGKRRVLFHKVGTIGVQGLVEACSDPVCDPPVWVHLAEHDSVKAILKEMGGWGRNDWVEKQYSTLRLSLGVSYNQQGSAYVGVCVYTQHNGESLFDKEVVDPAVVTVAIDYCQGTVPAMLVLEVLEERGFLDREALLEKGREGFQDREVLAL